MRMMSGLAVVLLAACAAPSGERPGAPADGAVDAAAAGAAVEPDGLPVGDAPTRARTPAGDWISWREHIIDDAVQGTPLTGGDGLQLADLDGDGTIDIVSVHESDTVYDGEADGFIRIAFGSPDPRRWTNVTLASGAEAAAPEDVAIADVDGDGWPDVMAAAELSHLIYLQNPGGAAARTQPWRRLILPQTKGRGSFIRVFLADLDGDGRPEAVAANKGQQNPDPRTATPMPVSVFKASGDPLQPDGWREIELGRDRIPQNAHPVDIDGDGDKDVVAGVRVGASLVLYENLGGLAFRRIDLRIGGARAGGFNLDFRDFNRDGRLDILAASSIGLAWLEQPAELAGEWTAHRIGDFEPDSLTAVVAVDIDGDGDFDAVSGGYSGGSRGSDPPAPLTQSMGRIGWFENPGDGRSPWVRHDVSRRQRGMFDHFVARDLDGDGDPDLVGTRGNSNPYDGVFWLEQVRSAEPAPAFTRARPQDSPERPLPPPGVRR